MTGVAGRAVVADGRGRVLAPDGVRWLPRGGREPPWVGDYPRAVHLARKVKGEGLAPEVFVVAFDRGTAAAQWELVGGAGDLFPVAPPAD